MNMVEKVARAICCPRGCDSEKHYSEGRNKRFPCLSYIHMDTARAAIAAMREPTKKMVKAAAKAMSPEHRPTPNYISVDDKHAIRFRAMIDAALKEFQHD